MSQLGTAFGSDYAAYITEQLDDLGITSSDPEYKAAISNATVLYVAQKSASLNAQSAMDTLANAKLYLMQNASANPTLMDVLEAAGSTGDPLTTAALMYGAVTAYANGSDSASATALKSQAASVTNATSLLDLFKAAANEDDFLDYCGTYTTDGSSITGTTPTDAFSADMEGYLGALDVLDTVSGEVDLTQSGTWSSDTVDELLAAILG